MSAPKKAAPGDQKNRMKITKQRLKEIIREVILAETLPTFNLRPGDIVRHKEEKFRGRGRVLSKSAKRGRSISVSWTDAEGNVSQQRHDPSMLMKVSK